jgi:hypothetical protein
MTQELGDTFLELKPGVVIESTFTPLAWRYFLISLDLDLRLSQTYAVGLNLQTLQIFDNLFFSPSTRGKIVK